MALAEDASSPAIVESTGSGTSVATAAFSPPAGSLVVALAGYGWENGTGEGTGTATVADSSSGNWATQRQQLNTNASYYGRTLVGAHFFSSAPGSITVTVTFPASLDGGGRYLVVKVITGADSTTPTGIMTGVAKTSSTTTYTMSVTPTYDGGLIYGVLQQSATSATATPNANSTEIDEWNNTTDSVGLAAFKTSSTTVAGVPITIGETESASGRGSISVIEVKVAPAGNNWTQTPTDTAVPTDSVTVLKWTAYTQTVTDTAVPSDSTSIALPGQIAVTDAAGVTDIAALALGTPKPVGVVATITFGGEVSNA